MSVLAVPAPRPPGKLKTLQEVLDSLGNVPLVRIIADPPPGTATERDVAEIEAHDHRLCELVDGTLVEKAVGLRESMIAAILIEFLGPYIRSKNLGILTGADGAMRLFPGMVRNPDVAFVSWARMPGGRVPTEPIPYLVPDLAVEVLSEGNTPAEMDRKRHDYFAAGVRLAWFVEPRDRTIAVYSSPTQFRVLTEFDTLDGADVLPGLFIPVRELFKEPSASAIPAMR